MPLTVNVGLSRKITEDYNSKGFTLNIAAELPASLVDDPNGLAAATNNLFAMANDLLEEQVRNASCIGDPTPIRNSGGNGNRQSYQRPQASNANASAPQANANGSRNNGGNGNGHSGGNGQGGMPAATQAQVRAIYNMAKRLGLDVDNHARQEYGLAVRDLTVKQASQVIDDLKAGFNKASEPAGAVQ